MPYFGKQYRNRKRALQFNGEGSIIYDIGNSGEKAIANHTDAKYNVYGGQDTHTHYLPTTKNVKEFIDSEIRNKSDELLSGVFSKQNLTDSIVERDSVGIENSPVKSPIYNYITPIEGTNSATLYRNTDLNINGLKYKFSSDNTIQFPSYKVLEAEEEIYNANFSYPFDWMVSDPNLEVTDYDTTWGDGKLNIRFRQNGEFLVYQSEMPYKTPLKATIDIQTADLTNDISFGSSTRTNLIHEAGQQTNIKFQLDSNKLISFKNESNDLTNYTINNVVIVPDNYVNEISLIGRRIYEPVDNKPYYSNDEYNYISSVPCINCYGLNGVDIIENSGNYLIEFDGIQNRFIGIQRIVSKDFSWEIKTKASNSLGTTTKLFSTINDKIIVTMSDSTVELTVDSETPVQINHGGNYPEIILGYNALTDKVYIRATATSEYAEIDVSSIALEDTLIEVCHGFSGFLMINTTKFYKNSVLSWEWNGEEGAPLCQYEMGRDGNKCSSTTRQAIFAIGKSLNQNDEIYNNNFESVINLTVNSTDSLIYILQSTPYYCRLYYDNGFKINFPDIVSMGDYNLGGDDIIGKELSIKITSDTISCYWMISIDGNEYKHIGSHTLESGYHGGSALNLIKSQKTTIDLYKSYIKLGDNFWYSYNSLQDSIGGYGSYVYKGAVFKLLNGKLSGNLNYRYFTLTNDVTFDSASNPNKVVGLREDGSIEYFDDLVISETEPSNTSVLWKDIINNYYKVYSGSWNIWYGVVVAKTNPTGESYHNIRLQKVTDLNKVLYKINYNGQINVGGKYLLKINGEINNGSVSVRWGNELIENITDFDNDIELTAKYCLADKNIYIIGNGSLYSGKIESAELYEDNLVVNGEFEKLGWLYEGAFKCGIINPSNPTNGGVNSSSATNGNIKIKTDLLAQTTYNVSLDYIATSNTLLTPSYGDYIMTDIRYKDMSITTDYANQIFELDGNGTFIGDIYNVSVTRSFMVNSDWRNSTGWVLGEGCTINGNLNIMLDPAEGSSTALSTSVSQSIEYILPGQKWAIKTYVEDISPATELSVLVNGNSVFYYKNEQDITTGDNESFPIDTTFTVTGSNGGVTFDLVNLMGSSVSLSMKNLVFKPANLCRNSEFLNADYWTLGVDTIILNSALNFNTLTTTTTTQSLKLLTNIKYDVEYTIINYTSGSIKVGINNEFGEVRSSNGTFKDVIEFNSNDINCTFNINVPSSFVGSITNIKIVPHNEIYDNDFRVIPSWDNSNNIDVVIDGELPLNNIYTYTDNILYQNQVYEISFDLEIESLGNNPSLMVSVGTPENNTSINIPTIETRRYTETFTTNNVGANSSIPLCALFISASQINGVMKNVTIKTKNILLNNDFSNSKNWQLYYGSIIPGTISYPTNWSIKNNNLVGTNLTTSDILFYKKKELTLNTTYNGTIVVSEINGADLQLTNGDTPITVTPLTLSPGEVPTGGIYKADTYRIEPFRMNASKTLTLTPSGNITNITLSSISMTALSNTAEVDEPDFNANNDILSKNITEFNVKSQGIEFVDGKLVAVSVGDKGYISGVYNSGKISNINRENILIESGRTVSYPIISDSDVLTTHNIEYIYSTNNGTIYITNKEPIMSETQPILDEDEVWYDLRNHVYTICKNASNYQVQLIARGLVGLDSNYNPICAACSSMKGEEKLQQLNTVKLVPNANNTSLVTLPASMDYSNYSECGSYTENYLSKCGYPVIYSGHFRLDGEVNKPYMYLTGTSYVKDDEVTCENGVYASTIMPVWDETKQMFVNPDSPADKYVCEVYYDANNKISEVYPIDAQYDIILTSRTYKRTVFRDIKKPLDVYCCSGGGGAYIDGAVNITNGGTSSIVGNGINIVCTGGETSINGNGGQASSPEGGITIDVLNGYKGVGTGETAIGGGFASFGCPVTISPLVSGFNNNGWTFGYGCGCGVNGARAGGSGAVIHSQITPLKLYGTTMTVGEGGTNTDIGDIATGQQGAIVIKLY